MGACWVPELYTSRQSTEFFLNRTYHQELKGSEISFNPIQLKQLSPYC